MKKIICYALSLMMILTVLAVPVAASTTAGYDATLVEAVDLTSIPDIKTLIDATNANGGYNAEAYKSGTAWKITDAAGLDFFSDIVNATDTASNFLGKSVYLANDINMSAISDFRPIGDNTMTAVGASAGNRVFRGTFDGQGHTISNLVMTSAEKGNVSVGLFGTIVGAEIRNLILDSSCSFTYTGNSILSRTAAVVAWAYTSPVEYNEYGAAVGADPTIEEDPNQYNDESSMSVSFILENIQNNANVKSNIGYAGGIVCAMSANTNMMAIIRNCSNNGKVEGMLSAAGIVGDMRARHLLMTNCSNAGDITSTYSAAGLIYNSEIINDAASGKKVWVRNCVSSGKVTAEEAEALVICSPHSLTETGCDGSAATVTKQQAPEYTGFGTTPVDYTGKLIGYVPAAATTKDLTNVLPICTYLDAPDDVKEFKISTPDDLVWFAKIVNSGKSSHLAGYTIYLENDINMAGVEMDPIGSPKNGVISNLDEASSFSGTFDGQGHVIDNLVMSAEVTADMAVGTNVNYAVMGLFGVINSATIKNVVLGSGCSFTLESTNEKAIDPCVGALVGMSYRGAGRAANSSIENCYSAATVNGSASSGGILGWIMGNTDNVTGITVINCTNAGNVTSGVYAGGIVGYINDRAATIVNCRNVGTITLSATEQSTSSGAAGICARPRSAKTVEIENCINNGLIKGPGTLGGIVAIESNITVSIINCTNFGNTMAGSGGINVGPIYGLDQTPSLQMSNNANLTGQTDATYTAYTVSTNFPNYKELDDAHALLFPDSEEEDGDTDDTTESTDDTTAPTENTTTAPTTTAAPATEKKGGCGSAVTGVFALVMMIGAAGISVCKKRD